MTLHLYSFSPSVFLLGTSTEDAVKGKTRSENLLLASEETATPVRAVGRGSVFGDAVQT
jgi:hypothetical protein